MSDSPQPPGRRPGATPAPARDPQITQLLRLWSGGDRGALDQLASVVYEELRKVARTYLSRERREHTLQPTALVNEAFFRLVDQRVSWQNRAQFFGIAAQCMRRILVDYARRRQASKRGSGEAAVELDESAIAATWGSPEALLELDMALEKLAQEHPRAARLAELHYFGGLTVDEAAVVVEVSPPTVKRDLRLARQFLGFYLRRSA